MHVNSHVATCIDAAALTKKHILVVHSNSPYPESPNQGTPLYRAGVAGKIVCTYILAGTL